MKTWIFAFLAWVALSGAGFAQIDVTGGGDADATQTQAEPGPSVEAELLDVPIGPNGESMRSYYARYGCAEYSACFSFLTMKTTPPFFVCEACASSLERWNNARTAAESLQSEANASLAAATSSTNSQADRLTALEALGAAMERFGDVRTEYLAARESFEDCGEACEPALEPNPPPDNDGGIYNDGGTLTLEGDPPPPVYDENGMLISGSDIVENPVENEGGIQSVEPLTPDPDDLGGPPPDNDGGIFNDGGTLTIDNSTIENNQADSDGGGIFNTDENIVIDNSTLTDNSANTEGGGLWNSATPDGFVGTCPPDPSLPPLPAGVFIWDAQSGQFILQGENPSGGPTSFPCTTPPPFGQWPTGFDPSALFVTQDDILVSLPPLSNGNDESALLTPAELQALTKEIKAEIGLLQGTTEPSAAVNPDGTPIFTWSDVEPGGWYNVHVGSPDGGDVSSWNVTADPSGRPVLEQQTGPGGLCPLDAGAPPIDNGVYIWNPVTGQLDRVDDPSAPSAPCGSPSISGAWPPDLNLGSPFVYLDGVIVGSDQPSPDSQTCGDPSGCKDLISLFQPKVDWFLEAEENGVESVCPFSSECDQVGQEFWTYYVPAGTEISDLEAFATPGDDYTFYGRYADDSETDSQPPSQPSDRGYLDITAPDGRTLEEYLTDLGLERDDSGAGAPAYFVLNENWPYVAACEACEKWAVELVRVVTIHYQKLSELERALASYHFNAQVGARPELVVPAGEASPFLEEVARTQADLWSRIEKLLRDLKSVQDFWAENRRTLETGLAECNRLYCQADKGTWLDATILLEGTESRDGTDPLDVRQIELVVIGDPNQPDDPTDPTDPTDPADPTDPTGPGDDDDGDTDPDPEPFSMTIAPGAISLSLVKDGDSCAPADIGTFTVNGFRGDDPTPFTVVLSEITGEAGPMSDFEETGSGDERQFPVEYNCANYEVGEYPGVFRLEGEAADGGPGEDSVTGNVTIIIDEPDAPPPLMVTLTPPEVSTVYTDDGVICSPFNFGIGEITATRGGDAVPFEVVDLMPEGAVYDVASSAINGQIIETEFICNLVVGEFDGSYTVTINELSGPMESVQRSQDVRVEIRRNPLEAMDDEVAGSYLIGDPDCPVDLGTRTFQLSRGGPPIDTLLEDFTVGPDVDDLVTVTPVDNGAGGIDVNTVYDRCGPPTGAFTDTAVFTLLDPETGDMLEANLGITIDVTAPPPFILIVDPPETLFEHVVGGSGPTGACPTRGNPIQFSATRDGEPIPLELGTPTVSGPLASRIEFVVQNNGSLEVRVRGDFNCSSAQKGTFTGTVTVPVMAADGSQQDGDPTEATFVIELTVS